MWALRRNSAKIMDKIVVSATEVAQVTVAPDVGPRVEPKLPPPVPTWAVWSLSPLVLLLPMLCIVAIILRVAMRNLPPRTRYGWMSFTNTLLVISGLLTFTAGLLMMSFVPLPSAISNGLADFDERSTFPQLPSGTAMTAQDVSEKLKSLVVIISPVRRSWLTGAAMGDGSFGAGSLLSANSSGYLFVSARHVMDGAAFRTSRGNDDVLVAGTSGTWSQGKVIGRHRFLDIALVWVPRHSGHGTFSQPIATRAQTAEGENIFVIGHPEGLRFTLSTGIVSRTSEDGVQISAPVSPGNSGGPVFDSKGNLVAIVTSMVDKHGDPNAENLNFSVRADELRNPAQWDLKPVGRAYVDEYLNSLAVAGSAPQAEEATK